MVLFLFSPIFLHCFYSDFQILVPIPFIVIQCTLNLMYMAYFYVLMNDRIHQIFSQLAHLLNITGSPFLQGEVAAAAVSQTRRYKNNCPQFLQLFLLYSVSSIELYI